MIAVDYDASMYHAIAAFLRASSLHIGHGSGNRRAS
jgi:hypothetical protein